MSESHGKEIKCKPEYIVVVDSRGEPLGEEEKQKCHDGKGILHGGFLVMVFNHQNELLLTRRSRFKRLWPHFWDGTVASHYHPRKSREETVKNRILQEIGVPCRELDYLFKFHYQETYRDVGSENEICDVYTVNNVSMKTLALNTAEISEHKFLALEEIMKEMDQNPGIFTPWFLVSFRKYLNYSSAD